MSIPTIVLKKKIVLDKKLVEEDGESNRASKNGEGRDKSEDEDDNKLVDLRKKNKLDEEDGNKNKHITSVLEKLLLQIKEENKSISDKEEKKKNQWRISSLSKAIVALKDHPIEIKSGKEAMELKGIGQGTADRIDIILETETLPELESGDIVSEESKAVTELESVSGIGEKTALRFYRDYGIKSVKDLIEQWQSGKFVVGKNKLTHHMELGLKYYDDFRTRIPRDEIDDFYPTVERFFEEIDPYITFDIAGSYRRKKATSGDIDILFAHKKLGTKTDIETSAKSYLSLFIDKLLDEGYLIDHMDQDFHTYYKGVALIKEIPRRIDVMIIPYNTYAAALMHATGSGDFNQRIRLHAMKRGYHLSQHGLYKVIKGKKADEPIPTKTEKEIFNILGVAFLQPEDRD